MYQVMVVDDERDVVDTLERYISEAGLGFHVVAKALNGDEALLLIDALSPDVVITDIKMPVVDGLTLLKSAKARGWDGCAVVISGYDEFEYAQQAIRLNVHDYLLKPIFPNAVADLLKNIRESHVKRNSLPIQVPLSAPVPREHNRQVGNLAPDYIVKAQEYIVQHYSHPLSLADVAKHVGVSPAYLSAQFSKWCHKSFVEFVAEVRIKRAKELLSRTSRPVREIAEMVGYDNPCYFSKLFRKATGQSPRRYRKAFLDIAAR